MKEWKSKHLKKDNKYAMGIDGWMDEWMGWMNEWMAGCEWF